MSGEKVEIELDLTEEEIALLNKMAGEKNITVDDLVEMILIETIKKGQIY